MSATILQKLEIKSPPLLKSLLHLRDFHICPSQSERFFYLNLFSAVFGGQLSSDNLFAVTKFELFDGFADIWNRRDFLMAVL